MEDEAGFDEDEEGEGQGQGQQPSAKPMAEPQAEEGAMDLEEGGDEIDPLDAFMADNEVKVAPVKTEDTAAAPKGGCCTGSLRLWCLLLHAPCGLCSVVQHRNASCRIIQMMRVVEKSSRVAC